MSAAAYETQKHEFLQTELKDKKLLRISAIEHGITCAVCGSGKPKSGALVVTDEGNYAVGPVCFENISDEMKAVMDFSDYGSVGQIEHVCPECGEDDFQNHWQFFNHIEENHEDVDLENYSFRDSSSTPGDSDE